jgi:hypothetical protein
MEVSLTSALVEVSKQVHTPAALPRERAPGTHCIVGWVGPEATGLHKEVKIFYPTGIRTILGRPTRFIIP